MADIPPSDLVVVAPSDDTLDMLRDLLITMLARSPNGTTIVARDEIEKAIERFGGRGHCQLMIQPDVAGKELHIWVESGRTIPQGTVAYDFSTIPKKRAN